MNRRGFIGKAMAALAGLVALPFVRPKQSSAMLVGDELGVHVPTGISTGLGYNFYDLQSVKPIPVAPWTPEPRRRVLVMDVWIKEDGERTTGVYRRGCDMPDVCSPRIACVWQDIKFEELKKGDHFRLIDHADALDAEDGRTVYIALDDSHGYGPGVTIDPKQSYSLAQEPKPRMAFWRPVTKA